MSYKPQNISEMMESGETLILETEAPDASPSIAAVGTEFRPFNLGLLDAVAYVSRVESAQRMIAAEVSSSRTAFERELRALWAQLVDPTTGTADRKLRAAVLEGGRLSKLVRTRPCPALALEGALIAERASERGVDPEACLRVSQAAADLGAKVAGLESARRDVSAGNDRLAAARDAWFAAWTHVVYALRAVVPADELDQYLVRWPVRRKKKETSASGDGTAEAATPSDAPSSQASPDSPTPANEEASPASAA